MIVAAVDLASFEFPMVFVYIVDDIALKEVVIPTQFLLSIVSLILVHEQRQKPKKVNHLSAAIDGEAKPFVRMVARNAFCKVNWACMAAR